MKKSSRTVDRVNSAIRFIGGEDMLDALIEGRAKIQVTLLKHTVDLDKPPNVPFLNAKAVKHNGGGVVEIELRSDDNLYVDGKKVILYLSESQQDNKEVIGYELLMKLESGELVLLNSNVLDYIYCHAELFPEHWKKDEYGETRQIFFWGSIFQNPLLGYLYVRYLYWGDNNKPYPFYSWLDVEWFRRFPAASIEC